VSVAGGLARRHRAPATLPPVAQRIFDFDGWTRVLAGGLGDRWEAAHAARAAEVVAGWERWTAGGALVHRDLRLDNTTFDAAGGSAVLLDWAYAAAGAPWIDLAQLAADVVATGHVLGPETATNRAYEMLRALPPGAARFVVGLAGMWCIRAATVPDTVMPSISTWRRARSAALRPLVTRLIAAETSEAGKQRQRLVD
jgi:aminoglycoside phosphotransferase (APT) family kinase protein